MKKATILFLIILMTSSALFTSCEEDEPIPTKKELLTDGIWNGVKYEEYKDGTLTYTESSTDRKIDFKTNGDVVFYEEDGSEGIYTWSFSTNETEIIINSDDGDIELGKILTLTQTNFVISVLESTDGTENKYISYFSR